MTIKAITLDLWDTIYHDCPQRDATRGQLRLELIHQRLYELGFAVERARLKAAVRRAADASKRQWDEEHFTPGAQERLLAAAALLGISLPEEEALRLAGEVEAVGHSYPPLPFAESKETIARLAGQYTLAIISDTGQTSGRMLRRVLERDGLLDYFAVFTFSDEAGASKPNEKAFRLTLERLGVSPEEAVHVGDNETKDTVGALNAGMTTIHLAAQPSLSYGSHPRYYQAERIGQVPLLLDSLPVGAGA
ncbi:MULTISPECIES: HAD family hydrolase [Paenibacillus]|uniref:HAD family hydrolase n=1 Tax=Paenibacillus TaxID=44249 RepID=UPI0022B8E327|nr:HAD family hydrolase [Paenibacillus caseinilyticus]MCZ8517875.1 HAD family hydrolase [Paenibacillus caseinilyticus]